MPVQPGSILLTIGAYPRSPGLRMLQVGSNEDTLVLTALLDFKLHSVVQDALTWGVPVYFSAECTVVHPRWYWTDKVVGQAKRYWRLSYAPLTRRWLLASSSYPLPEYGIGTGLAQRFDSLGEALGAMQRIIGWPIGNAYSPSWGKSVLKFRFQLDTALLPKTLQIGSSSSSDWQLLIEREVDLSYHDP